MSLGANNLWLIPLLPLLAAAVLSVAPKRALATICSIGAMARSFVLSLSALAGTFETEPRTYSNFDWLSFGTTTLKLGFLLDPLTASMLVMVTFVGLLIFIYSIGYMAHDPNYARFFCFMSLFAAGMLAVIISNSLLLLFICWEIVGLASYLLIGFWYLKPSAAAAAKKAFLTTRIGDIGFFLGMIWLYHETGTLLFYDNGNGALEFNTLNNLVTKTAVLGFGASTLIALLIFCGAMGKSGQVPLHVWLPDAMEGPTPVSALIHAATMVAAGVFLVARVYPLMDADVRNLIGYSTALSVVTWVGGITAVFAALIAVAQNDIKRILAYSTVSQLGYMMMGLGAGGVFVGMFHLLTHAFFKALLFLGAGSVIHGSHEEQDITKMGGLRKTMPLTFAAYGIGMMALAGVLPLSGFWSKDEILHATSHWGYSKIPFLLGLFGAFLTAFYMTRQMFYVFFGESRAKHTAHESPRVMTIPLVILAAFSAILGLLATPAWPWLHSYLSNEPAHGGMAELFKPAFLLLAILSTLVVAAGVLSAWGIYRRIDREDPLQVRIPGIFSALSQRLWVDEAYDASVLRFTRWIGLAVSRMESTFFAMASAAFALLTAGFGWLSRLFDNFVIDLGFDRTCRGLSNAAAAGSKMQGAQIQNYVPTIALALVVLVLVLAWGGCKPT